MNLLFWRAPNTNRIYVYERAGFVYKQVGRFERIEDLEFFVQGAGDFIGLHKQIEVSLTVPEPFIKAFEKE